MNFLSTLVLFAILISQAFIWLLFSFELLFLLLAHLIFSFIFASVIFLWRKKLSPYVLFLFLFTVFLSILGVFIFIAASLVKLVKDATSKETKKGLADFFPSIFTSKSQHIYFRLQNNLENLSDKDSLDSYLVVAKHGTLHEKRSLLANIVKHINAGLVPVLKILLQDKNNFIRIQAASIITKIEKDFVAELKKHKNDNLKLAQIYFAHALLHISAQEKQDEYFAKAKELLLHEKTKKSFRSEHYLMLAKIYQIKRDYEKSQSILDEIKVIDENNIGDYTLLKTNNLYQLTCFADLRSFAAKQIKNLDRENSFHYEAFKMASLWGK